MPRRLSHDEIMAGFAELRRVVGAPDFPLQHGGRPLPSGDVGGSTAPRKCAGPGDEFNAADQQLDSTTRASDASL